MNRIGSICAGIICSISIVYMIIGESTPAIWTVCWSFVSCMELWDQSDKDKNEK